MKYNSGRKKIKQLKDDEKIYVDLRGASLRQSNDVLIVNMLNKKEQKKLIDLMLENAKKGRECFEYKVAYQESKIKEILDFLKTVLIKTKLEVDEFELDGGKKITTLDAIIGYAGIDKDKFMMLQKTIDKNNIKPT